MDAVAVRAGSTRGSRLTAWSDWMTTPDELVDDAFKAELIGTLYGHKANIVFAVVCVGFLLISYGLLYDARAACGLFALLLPAGLARYATIAGVRGPVPLLTAGLVWAAAVGSICGECGRTGQPMLTVFSGLVATGIAFGGAYINAGAPRFATIQVCLFTIPYAVLAGLYGAPGMIVILLQSPLWLIGICVLIRNTHANQAKLIKARRLTHHLAFHDSLTGLPNRAQFMERLAAECDSVAQDPGRGCYVLYLDLDGFKTVNDTLGHHAGDDLLRAVANRFQGLMRPADLFGRLGGDEFAVILPSVTAAQVHAIGERLIAAAGQPFLLEGAPPISIGVSIGGVELAPASDVRRTLQAADTMLYAAKRAGKGTLRLAHAA
jgi:diguanylate cyclase (GGDEF)-like protein